MKLLRLEKNGKRPLKAGSFDGEDNELVKEWVNDGGNYGILTGAISGICVIDIDNHHGIDGMRNLNDFLETYDITLPITKAVKTPTGGAHLYFELPSEYNDTQFSQNINQLEGVDFQVHGRYVVGWGSKIDNGEYKQTRTDEMAIIPEKWLKMFEDKSIQSKNKKRERKWTANFLGEILEGADGGSRNIYLTKMIGKLFATGLEHEEVRVWSMYVNQIACNPPLEESEVMQTFKSVQKREIRRMEEES